MNTDVILSGENLQVGYGGNPIIDRVNIAIPRGEITVIVGPNACGKSTLLRALSRVLPSTGMISLTGKPLAEMGAKEIARTMSMLPQSPVTPDGIRVDELVARGRYPYQNVFGSWSEQDEQAVADALEHAGISAQATRRVDELSGGQRQRVWLAMVLAQDTPLVLLDEPTTYLDITHQVEVLNLSRKLQQAGKTVVMVLHELSMAFRYATNLVVMKDGAIQASGPVNEVVTPELISQVYELDCILLEDPETGRPIVVPKNN
ncbi:ABC transporter ATP-binding protein [Corynebacterium sp.]|uniref:ABC transporter ATP-binding protein n=1 Tax=Corynebacterium sp. TaxID=1720 RepID=UPI0027BA84E3|nr:ABC transporter ATP-binding protein [Corynebacterium sp.]